MKHRGNGTKNRHFAHENKLFSLCVSSEENSNFDGNQTFYVPCATTSKIVLINSEVLSYLEI